MISVQSLSAHIDTCQTINRHVTSTSHLLLPQLIKMASACAQNVHHHLHHHHPSPLPPPFPPPPPLTPSFTPQLTSLTTPSPPTPTQPLPQPRELFAVTIRGSVLFYSSAV